MLLEVKNLKKYFKIDSKTWLKAVDDVSFGIEEGVTLGLVGESGCGKSTLGRTVIGLYPPTDGSILFEGRDITRLTAKERVALTRKMQIIYQDPYACLDPRMTVADIIAEGLDIHGICKGEERRKRIYELLRLVGMNEEHVNLLEDLQKQLGLTYLFIAHDISMVAHISDRIAVMYLGTMAELAPSKDIMESPLHPYTKALLSAVPFADPDASRARNRIMLTGDVPSPMSAQTGCKFASRCSQCTKACREEAPTLREVRPGHFVSCHLYDEERS